MWIYCSLILGVLLCSQVQQCSLILGKEREHVEICVKNCERYLFPLHCTRIGCVRQACIDMKLTLFNITLSIVCFGYYQGSVKKNKKTLSCVSSPVCMTALLTWTIITGAIFKCLISEGQNFWSSFLNYFLHQVTGVQSRHICNNRQVCVFVMSISKQPYAGQRLSCCGVSLEGVCVLYG